ncbi:Fibrous sheath-interacting protein 1 [Liparis tanakae]|uniref:Fibrous sheath-interacting protein 1 n=1 Tax=Liparis tanakae TaxID=230148 RepID=A0A4Z2JAN0_9TELE|nr:Fibrous sheath-interacting protein 1 [Liparis tanakae]
MRRFRGPAAQCGAGQCPIEVTDEENDDSKLQGAIEDMRRLDEILSAKICTEKENTPEGHSECAQEAMNTRLFLALEAPPETEEEDDFVPVFETQVPHCEHNRDGQQLEQSKKKSASWTGSSELTRADTEEEQFEDSLYGASKSKNKQKDFVKRNIEAENERLAKLLQEVDEGEEGSPRGTDSEEDMWAVSVPTGLGYTPEPPDLEQLTDIDSKIRLLSVQSSYTSLSMWQGRDSEDGWRCSGDLQPGEKVLQDIKERRWQERRLQEIQQQLEILNQVQEMTCRRGLQQNVLPARGLKL